MFGKCASLFRVLCPLMLWVLPAVAAQNAMVQTDSAIVYQKANFDSKVLGYLRAGRKMKISNGKFNGAFYRVRLKQGLIGYISDVDVMTEAAAKKAEAENPQVPKETKPKRPKHILETTYLGPVVGMTGFAEIINKQEFKDTDYITYGGKWTFPFHGFDGTFFMDVNLVGSFSAPKYYQTISQSGASGYMCLLGSVLNFQLFDFAERRGMFYLGGGPLLTFSSFLVEVNGSKLQLDELRAGGLFQLGLAFDLGGSVFKLEPKFYVEKASYNGVDIAFQFAL